MSLRAGPDGKPVGLDWDKISAHCPQDPGVWGKLPPPRKEEKPGRTSRPGPQRIAPDVAERIIHLYTVEQLSGAVIGNRVGVRHATVYKVLRRHGVEPRSKGFRSSAA
jgi:hypothetical protein